jgi:hypothetical protein
MPFDFLPLVASAPLPIIKSVIFNHDYVIISSDDANSYSFIAIDCAHPIMYVIIL